MYLIETSQAPRPLFSPPEQILKVGYQLYYREHLPNLG